MRVDEQYYYWNKGEAEPLGPYFSTREFSCHCRYPECVEQKASKTLVLKLSAVRSRYNAPLTITSGFRCAKKQADLAASGRETAHGLSQHELGNAADICGNNQSEVSKLVHAEFMAVGDAKTWLHCDTRADKVRKWTYKS